MKKQEPRWAPGAILADAMYTITELCERLAWSSNDLSVALHQGLRFYRFADITYVFGLDAMEFIKTRGQTVERSES